MESEGGERVEVMLGVTVKSLVVQHTTARCATRSAALMDAGARGPTSVSPAGSTWTTRSGCVSAPAPRDPCCTTRATASASDATQSAPTPALGR